MPQFKISRLSLVLGSIFLVMSGLASWSGEEKTSSSEKPLSKPWVIETVDSSHDVGLMPSLALDKKGQAHIAYYDGTNSDLKYAHWDGGRWLIQTIDSKGDVGWYASIALDQQDNPQISYLDLSNNDLKYAKWTGRNWLIQTVDAEGKVGWYTSLSCDQKGQPHIAYFDVTNGALKYARLATREDLTAGSDLTDIKGAWKLQTVDPPNVTSGKAGSGEIVGLTPSLALDQNDQPHIAYRDVSNQTLKYTKKALNQNGSGWLTEVVDSKGDFWYPSLVIDKIGKSYISYYNAQGQNLNYAKREGRDWLTETVDTEGNVGWYSSLVVLENGQVYIACRDISASDIKYAKMIGPRRWSIENLDSNSIIAVSLCMKFDNEKRPHIAYYDASKKSLQYAKRLKAE